MHYAITKQIAPLAAPGTRTSQINRVFNAALGEFLDLHVHGGSPYAKLYEKYMNIAPRFRPRSSDCDPWVAPEDADDALQTMLRRGVIRFGYVSGIPYVYRDDHETLTGFDYELGETLAAIIGTHYHGHPERLRAEWVEVTLTGGDEQADKLAALPCWPRRRRVRRGALRADDAADGVPWGSRARMDRADGHAVHGHHLYGPSTVPSSRSSSSRGCALRPIATSFVVICVAESRRP